MRKLLGIAIMIALLVCSCTTTKFVEVPVKTIEKEYIHNTRVDSVILRDSIDRWRSGDTLYIYKERTKYMIKERVDTVLRTDTITEVVRLTEVKEVKVNHLKWYQKWLMYLGGGSLVLLALILTHKATKLKLL